MSDKLNIENNNILLQNITNQLLDIKNNIDILPDYIDLSISNILAEDLNER